MENQLLKYLALVKTVETGSFTRAAQALNYAQSSVSKMVADLEAEWGMTLLERSKRGVCLTSAGEQVLPFLRKVLNDHAELEGQICRMNGIETGVVRIGTVSSVSAHWLPQVIRAFWEKHPNVQIVLHQGDYSSVQEWVRNGAVDFGFVNPQAVKGLETMVVKSGQFRAVVPIGHPLAERECATLEELAVEPFLMVESGAYGEVEEAFAAAGIVRAAKQV